MREELIINYNYYNEDLKLSEQNFFEYIENKITTAINYLVELFNVDDKKADELRDYALSSIEKESDNPLVSYFDNYFWNDFVCWVALVKYCETGEEMHEDLLNDSYFGSVNRADWEKFLLNKHEIFKIEKFKK